MLTTLHCSPTTYTQLFSNSISMRFVCEHLLVQWGLQVQGPVRHQEAAGRLHHWLRTRLLWSVLNLPYYQSHRIPRQTNTSNQPSGSPVQSTALRRASSHLLWIFSSIDLAQNALISKSTPQACSEMTGWSAPLWSLETCWDLPCRPSGMWATPLCLVILRIIVPKNC